MVDHNQALDFLGECECPCHRPNAAAASCWCQGAAPHPYQIAHNDAVDAFGRCDTCRIDRSACNVATEPRWAAAIAKRKNQDRDRRLKRGVIRSSSDVRRAIQLGIIGR